MAGSAGPHSSPSRASVIDRDAPRLLHVVQVLFKHGVRFVLIGGYAAVVRGSPMLTGDVDICYARDEENLHRLAAALRELKATLRGAPPDVPFHLDAMALKIGDRFTFSTSAGPVDILATPSGTKGFDELDASADDLDLDGLTVRAASLEDLIRMKRAAGRPKDLIALEWLGALRDEVASTEE